MVKALTVKDEQLQRFAQGVEKLYNDHKELLCNADTSVSGVIDGLRMIVESDKYDYEKAEIREGREPHGTVMALLDSVIEALRAASFEYYASFK